MIHDCGSTMVTVTKDYTAGVPLEVHWCSWCGAIVKSYKRTIFEHRKPTQHRSLLELECPVTPERSKKEVTGQEKSNDTL